MVELECKNLSIGYDGKAVRSNINFAVESGDYLCIVGENGAGKSTLIKTLLRLLSPISGELNFYGLKQNQIGYMPQQTQIQKDFPASVREVVLSGCLNNSKFIPYFTRAQKEMAENNMELLGISNLSKKCYRELSGGQQQRVLLARALCAAQKILLLDEPVAGLDPIATQQLYTLIDRLNKQLGITIIIISHDIRAAIKYANKILLFDKKIFFGNTSEFSHSAYAIGALGEAL